MKRTIWVIVCLLFVVMACNTSENSKIELKSQSDATELKDSSTNNNDDQKDKTQNEYYTDEIFKKSTEWCRPENDEYYEKLLTDKNFRPHDPDFKVDNSALIYNIPKSLGKLTLKKVIIQTKRNIGLVALVPWKNNYCVKTLNDSVLISGLAYYCIHNCFHCGDINDLQNPEVWIQGQTKTNLQRDDCDERPVVLLFDKPLVRK